MKISVKNLGAIRDAEFSLGEMTIICGENNTGKTYATYALFGFLTFWREAFSIDITKDIVDHLLSEGTANIDIDQYIKQAPDILKTGCMAYAKQLSKVFAAPPDRFKDTDFQISLDSKDIQPAEEFKQIMRAANAELFSITKNKGNAYLEITLLKEKSAVKIPPDIIVNIIGDALKNVIFGKLFPNPFIASAERTGAAIFRKELNFPRNRILEEMSKEDKKGINPMELLFKVYEDYALPVKTNVEFTRQIETIAKRKSFIAENHPEVLDDFSDIIGGEYAVTKNNELYYLPKGKHLRLSMDESSSAVRSLLDIGFYLRHVAARGDLLIVDEPELNLHPENQCRVARLFARLVKLGVKTFLTTHSDYLIKELNTLIMLNHDKPHLKRIAGKYGYKKEEMLSSDQIKVYIAEESLKKLEGGQRRTKCQTMTLANIDPELGIEARSFDKTIERMNRIQEEIIWGGE